MTYFLLRQTFQNGDERWLIDFEDDDLPYWLPLFWRDKRGNRGENLLRWVRDPDQPDYQAGEYGRGELFIDPRLKRRMEEYRTDRIIEEKRIKAAKDADDKRLQREKTEGSVKKKRVQRPSQFLPVAATLEDLVDGLGDAEA